MTFLRRIPAIPDKRGQASWNDRIRGGAIGLCKMLQNVTNVTWGLLIFHALTWGTPPPPRSG
jgi:hypothetical protein